MADQTSTLLQLILQETGNNNNNWGVILNQQLTKLESAITGQGVLTLTGGSKVLTDDEQRPGILLLTGNLNSDATVEVKPRVKHWIILNTTTGDYTVGVRTPNNPTYLLPRGQAEHIWSDGVTIRAMGESGRVPVGATVMSLRTQSTTANPLIPPGFIEPTGQAVSRVLYKRLFDVYGTTYGVGDGSNTFNLPDLVGRYLRARGGNAGSTIGAKQDPMIQEHTHTASTNSTGAHTHSGSTDTESNHSHSYSDATVGWDGWRAGSGTVVTTYNDATSSNKTTGSAGSHAHSVSVTSAGAHSHTVTVNNAGGVETRPLSMVGVALIRFQ